MLYSRNKWKWENNNIKRHYDVFTLLTDGSIDNLFEECIDKTETNFTGEMKFGVELIVDEDSRKKFNFRKNDNLKSIIWNANLFII